MFIGTFGSKFRLHGLIWTSSREFSGGEHFENLCFFIYIYVLDLQPYHQIHNFPVQWIVPQNNVPKVLLIFPWLSDSGHFCQPKGLALPNNVKYIFGNATKTDHISNNFSNTRIYGDLKSYTELLLRLFWEYLYY